MLAKLSFRNAKRQAHDYIIYFVTLTAIFSLIHGLNSLLFAEDDIFPLDDSTFIPFTLHLEWSRTKYPKYLPLKTSIFLFLLLF